MVKVKFERLNDELKTVVTLMFCNVVLLANVLRIVLAPHVRVSADTVFLVRCAVKETVIC